MLEIEFTCTGSSAIFGNFATGDRLRCSAAHARHFVEQAHCARYVTVAAPAPAEVSAPASVPVAAVAAKPQAARRRAAAAAPETPPPAVAAAPEQVEIPQ